MSTDQAISQLLPAPKAGAMVDVNPQPQTPNPIPTSARHLAGKRARVSVDNAEDLPFLAAMFIEPPPDADTSWRTSLLDDQTLDRIEPARLIELLIDISPEISRALWDFVRMFNPGWECKVFKLNGDTEDKRGQKVIDDFITQLGELYGAFDVVLSRLIIGGMLRGAFLAELVLDENGRRLLRRLPLDQSSLVHTQMKCWHTLRPSPARPLVVHWHVAPQSETLPALESPALVELP